MKSTLGSSFHQTRGGKTHIRHFYRRVRTVFSFTPHDNIESELTPVSRVQGRTRVENTRIRAHPDVGWKRSKREPSRSRKHSPFYTSGIRRRPAHSTQPAGSLHLPGRRQKAMWPKEAICIAPFQPLPLQPRTSFMRPSPERAWGVEIAQKARAELWSLSGGRCRLG